MKKHFFLPFVFAACAWAEEQVASQWNADVAYACWSDKHRGINLALLHVQGTQRLLPGNDDTWLRVELSGSWALDSRSVSFADDVFAPSVSSTAHADYFGPHDLVLPEIALMQYFAGHKACLVAGMVNLTNDFDAVGIANDSFATFAHGALVNSYVLPLPDSNAGAVLRVDFTGQDYAVFAVSRTGAVAGSNPFRSGPPGCCFVGEYGHVFQENGLTLRLNPFYHHQHMGMAASMEWEACDHATLFARAGMGSGGSTGATADFSCGAKAKLFPSRADDFVGIAYALIKADRSAAESDYNKRESVMELMYNLQVTKYVKLMPHMQYTLNPAYAGAHSHVFTAGFQGVLSF